MSELRWILLAAGIALLIGVYVWGVRSRKRSATPDFERLRRVDPVPPPAVAKPLEVHRREPRITLDEMPAATSPDSDVPELDFDVGAAAEEPPAARAAQPAIARVETGRTEPTISSTAQQAVRQAPPGEPGAREPAPATPGHAAGAAPPVKSSQKVVAVRVTAPLPSRFEGALLRETLRSHGLQHGRYDIYHRLAPDGRPIISLASLLEPGTFDPATMDGVAYPGVALFTVLPGPVSALDALEDLLVTSRSLAMQLKGTVLDDRGAPLSLQRIASMRDEVLTFERGARAPETVG
jgi:cell division protein ZipA